MLEEFPVVVDVPVRRADQDALGHVNHTRYLRYFEIARLAYLERIGLDPPGATWREFGLIIASLTCRFLAPVTYPDTVSVGAKILSMSSDRCTMEHVAVSQALDKAAASGTAVIVAYDYVAGRRRPFPTNIVQRVVALEGHEFLPDPEPDAIEGRPN
jgi:acyl-CoA thioester hydrolase